jgi:hypothetical protein
VKVTVEAGRAPWSTQPVAAVQGYLTHLGMCLVEAPNNLSLTPERLRTD